MPKKSVKKRSTQKQTNNRWKKFGFLRKTPDAIALIAFLLSALFLGNIVGNKFFSDKIINISPQDTTKANPVSNQQTTSENSTTDARLQEIFSNAVEADTIEISDCKTNPQTTTVALGKEFTIQNKDSSDHSLKIWDKDYQLKANDKLTLTATFGKGVGFYGIQCDSTEAGYINIP